MDADETTRHREYLRHFASNGPAIRAFIWRLVPLRADADDVMQEVAVVLWEKFAEFRSGGDFRAWAHGVARYEALAWIRDHGRDRLVLGEDVAAMIAEESLSNEERLSRQRDALETCLAKLESKQRTLLLAAYEPQARMEDVAVRSGRSTAGFYQWLYRMRSLLLECVTRELAAEASR